LRVKLFYVQSSSLNHKQNDNNQRFPYLNEMRHDKNRYKLKDDMRNNKENE